MTTKFALILSLSLTLPSFAQSAAPADGSDNAGSENAAVDLDQAAKLSDDLMWQSKLGAIAEVDKFSYTGPPRKRAGNPMILYAYSFIPRRLDRAARHPLLVLVHGGVHSSFTTGGPANAAYIVRELMEEGYVVVAPDYRGSTGYGASYYKAIDYGGKENDDALAARAWMLERYPFLDPARVGIVGWSHGGMIALMNVFQHPEAYACAFAGEPVSDLIARKVYKKTLTATIADSAGEAAAADDNEYRRRSPVTWAVKLETPLLLHGNTTDEEVHVVEVERLVDALRAAGRKFEYKIYQAAPGGHHFNRIDTKLARDSRQEIYAFLKRYLNHDVPTIEARTIQ